jgi:hypothetical protein
MRRPKNRVRNVLTTHINVDFMPEVWSIFHNELDLDGNGHLDAEELTLALSRAGKRGFRSTRPYAY